MNKVTEARRKILRILGGVEGQRMIVLTTEDALKALRKTQEIVLNDEEWNEAKQETKTEEGDGEYRSLLDVAIDLLPDEAGD